MTTPEPTSLDFEALADALQPARMDPARERRLRDRILERARTARADAPLTTVGPQDGEWQKVLAGVELKFLHDHGDAQSFLLRLAPGASLARHHHDREEVCVVLEGTVLLEGSEAGAGTYHLAPAGSDHASITTRTGCLLFLRASLDANLAA